jgi:hypothetical protein
MDFVMQRSAPFQAIGLDITRDNIRAILVSRKKGVLHVQKYSECDRQSNSELEMSLLEVLQSFPTDIPVIPVLPGLRDFTFPAAVSEPNDTVLLGDLVKDVRKRIPVDSEDYLALHQSRYRSHTMSPPVYFAFKADLTHVFDILEKNGYYSPGAISEPAAHVFWNREIKSDVTSDVFLVNGASDMVRVAALKNNRMLAFRQLIRKPDRMAQEVWSTYRYFRGIFTDWSPGNIDGIGEPDVLTRLMNSDQADKNLDLSGTESDSPVKPGWESAMAAVGIYLLRGSRSLEGRPPARRYKLIQFRPGVLTWMTVFLVLMLSLVCNMVVRTRGIENQAGVISSEIAQTQRSSDGIPLDKWKIIETLSGIDKGIPLRHTLSELSSVQIPHMQIDRIQGSGAGLTVSGIAKDYTVLNSYTAGIRRATEEFSCSVTSSDRDGPEGWIRFSLHIARRNSGG